MQWDRWVLPPAVAAGVFSVAAISPPVAEAPRGLRVSTAGEVAPGRPVLVAVSVEDRAAESLTAPRRVLVSLLDRRARAVDRAVLVGLPGTSAAYGALAVAGDGPWTLRAEAGRDTARSLLGASPRPLPYVPAVRDTAPIEVLVTGGALVPEVPATVLVRALGATTVTVESEGEALTVEPGTVSTDGCGVGSFRATLRGMDAPVHVVAPATGAQTRQRLAVDAGGLAVTLEAGGFTVRSALDAGEVYYAAGDTRGPTLWGTAVLRRDADGASVAVALPATARWALASASPAFVGARGGWREAPAAPPPCATREASMRWFAAVAPQPSVGPVRRVYDGAARAVERGGALRTRVRAVALGFLAVAVLLEAALVVGAGLTRDPSVPVMVEKDLRARLGMVLASVAVLLIAGFALALNALVTAAGE